MTFTNESELLKTQSTIKRFLGLKKSPISNPDNLVFIDVSDIKTIVFDTLQNENIVITDRRLLDSVLKIIATTGTYRFVLSNINFDKSTQYDQKLARTISFMPRAAFPVYKNEYKNTPFQAIKGGTVNYHITENSSLFASILDKFRLVQDNGEKSLPLYMLEQVNNKHLSLTGMFLRFKENSTLYFNNITFDAHLNTSSLIYKEDISRVKRIREILQEWQYKQPQEIAEDLRDKIVVIGDFQSDLYNTAYGSMPGILVLLNIYFSLLLEQNTITFGWIVYLIVCFFILSYFILYGEKFNSRHIRERKTKWLESLFFGEVLTSFLFNLLLLYIISLGSYLIFGKMTAIAFLSAFLTLEDYFIDRRKAYESFFEIRRKNFKNYVLFLLKYDKHAS